MSYRREDISNSIWDDETFDGLSNSAALLYIWSFTNPRCGMAGVYRVKRRHLCEGRLTGKALDKALEELRAAKLLFYVEGVLWVRSRVKHLRTKGVPMRTSIRKDVEAIAAEHPLRSAFCDEYRRSWAAEVVADLEGFKGGSEGVQENGAGKPDSGTPREPLEGSQGRGRGPGGGVDA